MASTAQNWTPGTVVWARVGGGSWWPGLVVPYEKFYFIPRVEPLPPKSRQKFTVMFFGDSSLALIPGKDIAEFYPDEHFAHSRGTHSPSVNRAYKKALQWIGYHGLAGQLPLLNPNQVPPEASRKSQDDHELELRSLIGAVRSKRMMIDERRIALFKERRSLKKRRTRAI